MQTLQTPLPTMLMPRAQNHMLYTTPPHGLVVIGFTGLTLLRSLTYCYYFANVNYTCVLTFAWFWDYPFCYSLLELTVWIWIWIESLTVPVCLWPQVSASCYYASAYVLINPICKCILPLHLVLTIPANVFWLV